MVKNGCGLKYGDHSGILYSSTNENWEKLFIQKHKLTTINFDIIPEKHLDHEERKVPKYENHKLRERKVKTPTRN